MGSLQRFVFSVENFIERYLRESTESLDGQESAEALDVHHEMTAGDREHFGTYLRAGVLSHLFALLETLLVDVAVEYEQRLGTTVAEESKRAPYIDQYLTFLRRACGLEIDIPKPAWRRLEMLRATRNKYVHDLSRDLPAEVREQLSDLLIAAGEGPAEIGPRFLAEAFRTIGSIAKSVETGYWKGASE